MRRWTEDEDAALRKHYPEHGLSWYGWDALLPDRTAHAISGRAVRMGIAYEGPAKGAEPEPRPEPKPEPAREAPGGDWSTDDDRLAVSALVLACGATGRKPSQVLDRLRQLTGGAAAGDAGGKVGDSKTEGRG